MAWAFHRALIKLLARSDAPRPNKRARALIKSMAAAKGGRTLLTGGGGYQSEVRARAREMGPMGPPGAPGGRGQYVVVVGGRGGRGGAGWEGWGGGHAQAGPNSPAPDPPDWFR